MGDEIVEMPIVYGAAPTVAAQQCGTMDEVAMIAARYAYADSECLETAIRAYLEAATPPDVAELVRLLETSAKPSEFRRRNPTLSDAAMAFRYNFEAGLLLRAATALRLSAGGGVPEGWKLVPVVPTPEMLGAFWRQKNNGTQELGETGPHTDDYSAYRAMLAASPTVEAGHVE